MQVLTPTFYQELELRFEASVEFLAGMAESRFRVHSMLDLGDFMTLFQLQYQWQSLGT